MRKLLFLVFTLFCITQAYPQLPIDINDSIYSEILNEQRSIKVFLPESHDPNSSQTYEVIYITDGEWAHTLFPFVYKFARDENYVPPAIIVALPNRYVDGVNQRDRDFLPAKAPESPNSGGADRFISFIKTELMPYIENTYPTNGTNSLFGHSYGGVFVVYTLLTQPDLFDTYYATDPALRWNNHYVADIAVERLKNLPPNKTLWIGGIESTQEMMGIAKMDSILSAHAPESLYWKVSNYPNEKHNSVRLKAIYDGIKFANFGYDSEGLAFHPMSGIVPKGEDLNLLLLTEFPDVRYTTDGSVPTGESPKMGMFTTLKAPAQVSVKPMIRTSKYDLMLSGNFVEGDYLPAVKLPKKAVPGGIKYAYYEGEWEKLPDFSKLKPVKTGKADENFNVKNLPKKENFACLFEGFIEIKEPGQYIFVMDSDDGSRLFIGDQLMIDYDGLHGSGKEKSYLVPLKKGFYPVRVEYFQKGGDMEFMFGYVKPNSMEFEMIPFDQQYSR